MKTLNKLVKFIETGRVSKGEISVNSKGVRYRYTTYFIDAPTKFDVKLFESAQLEFYGKHPRKLGKPFDRIDFDRTQIKLDYPKYKTSAFGKLSLNRLEILD